MLAVAVATGVGAHASADRAIRAGDADGTVRLPRATVLRAIGLGHRALVADLLWVRAIQYYGYHRMTDRKYDSAKTLFEGIYETDPAFTGAVRFGALILAQDANDPESALALLERAERDHPDRWEFPFDRGFILQTVRRDLQGAAAAYTRAASLDGAPDLAIRLAGLSWQRLGESDAARQVWQMLLADKRNQGMAELAAHSLRNLDLENAVATLAQGVDLFAKKTGRLPVHPGEVVDAGLLDGLPMDPFGGSFVIQPDRGGVFSTTLVDRRMARERDRFAAAAAGVRTRDGRYPGSLEELMARGTMEASWSPLGLSLEYDSTTGVVSWNPPWSPSEPGNQGGKGA
ncbi:MAG: tetratricopeptide repeat protein [Gemmatimonadota bacterium]|jgi:hypothetical protein|nr:tetratricopeptide repeat protein [Gemmatimonadota bacterium]